MRDIRLGGPKEREKNEVPVWCTYFDDSLCVLAGSYFVLSMMDRLWRPDLTQEEAVELMEKGIQEVRPDDIAGTSWTCSVFSLK